MALYTILFKPWSRREGPVQVIMPGPCLQPTAQEQSKVKTHRSSEPVSPSWKNFFFCTNIPTCTKIHYSPVLNSKRLEQPKRPSTEGWFNMLFLPM